MMQFIQMPRGAGKTTKLLEKLAAESDSFYVAADAATAKFAFDLSKRMGLVIDRSRFVTAQSVAVDSQGTRLRVRNAKLLVDNVDDVLSTLLGSGRITATVTYLNVEAERPVEVE